VSKAKTQIRRVPFMVRAPEARNVRLAGDFTDWQAGAIRLSHDGRGAWRTVLLLEPGRYQYRLLVDEAWCDPAEAVDKVPNPFGSENCVLKVG